MAPRPSPPSVRMTADVSGDRPSHHDGEAPRDSEVAGAPAVRPLLFVVEGRSIADAVTWKSGKLVWYYRDARADDVFHRREETSATNDVCAQLDRAGQSGSDSDGGRSGKWGQTRFSSFGRSWCVRTMKIESDPNADHISLGAGGAPRFRGVARHPQLLRRAGSAAPAVAPGGSAALGPRARR
jgi:hypothetical protein